MTSRYTLTAAALPGAARSSREACKRRNAPNPNETWQMAEAFDASAQKKPPSPTRLRTGWSSDKTAVRVVAHLVATASERRCSSPSFPRTCGRRSTRRLNQVRPMHAAAAAGVLNYELDKLVCDKLVQ